ncbi:MAG: DUF2076 domain-containing protein [Burkholderiales bacterium]
MTPQETGLLNEFLSQLTQVRGIIKDPAADVLIAKATAQQPDATYLLVQRSLLLDQALDEAKHQIEKLEAELRGTRAQPPAAAGGFLSGVSAWGRKPAVAAAPAFAGAARQPAASMAVAPQAAQSAMGGGGGGGFLGRAAATAAGVVGGAFLFQGISQLMGNRGHTPEPTAQQSTPAASEGLLANSFANDPAPPASVDNGNSLEQYDTAMDDSAGYDDSSSEA